MALKGERATHCKRGHEFTPENTIMVERPNGSYQRCRTCTTAQNEARDVKTYMKVYQLNARYGITPAQRSAMLVEQDGLCAICYERPAVVIDHDHETGEVRGMLCNGCNVSLGVIGEGNLAFAAEYVSRLKAEAV